MRVLVVEDELRIAQFIRQGLTEAGYAVDLAKLERWMAQIRARDYFGSPAAAAVDQR